MNRTLFKTALAAGIVAVAIACADGGGPTAPVAPLQSQGSIASHWGYDGHGSPQSRNAALVRCEHHPEYVGSADIGPKGGQIIVGTSRVIVPSGALSKTIHITATIPEGEYVTIRFEFGPDGTVFKKPAGLILDARGCNISEYYAPAIVHLSESGEILEYIPSYYSNYWHVVAAPIWHFSGYGIAY